MFDEASATLEEEVVFEKHLAEQFCQAAYVAEVPGEIVRLVAVVAGDDRIVVFHIKFV